MSRNGADDPSPRAKQWALRAFDILSPRLKLALQEAQFGDLYESLRVESLPLEREKFSAKELKDLRRYSLYAVLSQNDPLSCMVMEIHFNDDQAGFHCTESSVIPGERLNKRTIMDVAKEVLYGIRRITGEPDERRLHSLISIPFLSNHKLVAIDVNKRFPKAIYYCEMCDFHMNDTSSALRHAGQSTEHSVHLRLTKSRKRLQSISKPSFEHSCALAKTFNKELAVPKDYHSEITNLIKNLEDVLSRRFSGCKVFLHGSYLTKLNGPESNVNLSAIIENTSETNFLFAYIQERFSEIGNAEEVKFNSSEHVPFLEFTLLVDASKLLVYLTVNDRPSILFDSLVATYLSIHEKLVTTLRLLRYWAQFTNLTKREWKGLRTRAIDLMFIHFLQQRGLVPVLHEINSAGRTTTEFDKWDLMKPLYQNNLKEINSLHGHSRLNYEDVNVGYLFIDFLRFYASEFEESNVVQITQKAQVPRNSMEWGRKFLTVKDPYHNTNIHYISKDMHVYTVNAIVKSFVYFGVARFKNGTPSHHCRLLTHCEKRQSRKKNAENGDVNESCTSSTQINDQELDGEREFDGTLGNNTDSLTNSHLNLHDPSLMVYSREFVCSLPLREGGAGVFNDRLRKLDILDDPSKHRAWQNKKLRQEKQNIGVHNYIFQILMLTDFKVNYSSASRKGTFDFTLDSSYLVHTSPCIICAICDEEGHVDQFCPKWKNRKSYVPVLQILSPQNCRNLARIIQKNYESQRLQKEDMEVMELVKREIQKRIKSVFPTAHLTEFGSVSSGFGTRGSDIDLCLRFTDADVLPENFNMTNTIARISGKLKGPDFVDVSSVPNAKVPIVKFKHSPTGVEGDISVYNALALHNTDLLRSYCLFDPRVAPLGLAIKKWAKYCEINDPAHGSLSSYAFIIMMLHYLQRIEPPVLPVLQQIQKKTKCEEESLVEGCDVRFFDHTELVSGFSYRNDSSVADLFVGFFDYFALEFDWTANVVQIGKLQNLLKYEKNWYERPICIEDPFKLTHNLSTAVNYKMAKYVMDTIDKTRNELRKCVFSLDASSSDSMESFLKSCKLSDEPPVSAPWNNGKKSDNRPPNPPANGTPKKKLNHSSSRSTNEALEVASDVPSTSRGIRHVSQAEDNRKAFNRGNRRKQKGTR